MPTAESIGGTWTYRGALTGMAENSFTIHPGIIEFKGQWYLFYHHNDYSPEFDKNRSARVDSLFFNADGTIQKVTPTLRGVGITDARKEIQLDRYSRLSNQGATIDYLNPGKQIRKVGKLY